MGPYQQKSNTTRNVLLSSGLAVALLALAVGLLWDRIFPPKPQWQPEDTSTKYDEFRAGSDTYTPSGNDEADIVRLIGRVVAKPGNPSRLTFARALDRDAYVERIAQHAGTAMTDAMARGLKAQLPVHPQMQGNLAEQGWTDFRVTRITMSAENAAIAYVLGAVEGYDAKMRFFLCRTADGWRLADFEDLDAGLSASALAGAALRAVRSSGLTLADFQRLVAALNAVGDENIDGAEQNLKLISARLPGPLEGLRYTIHATVASNRGESQDVLHYARLALAANSDIPVISVLKARAHIELGQYDEAMVCAQAYDQLLGESALGLQLMAEAHLGKGQPERAEELCRRALRSSPTNTDVLRVLARSLPWARKNELAQLFIDHPSKSSAYAIVARELLIVAAYDELAKVNDVYVQIVPNDNLLPYYRGQVHCARDQFSEGLPLLRDAMSRQAAGSEDHKVMTGEYLARSAAAGKALEAYAEVADHAMAFDGLAPELRDAEKWQELIKLCETHAAALPGNDQSDYYLGHAYLGLKQYDRAEEVLARGMGRQLDLPVFSSYLRLRVNVLVEANRVDYAYETIKPRPDVFQALMQHLVWQERPDDMAKLLKRAQADMPGGLQVAYWSARVPYERKSYADALKVLRDRWTELNAHETTKWSSRHMLLRCLVHTGQAKQAEVEFQRLPADDQSDFDALLIQASLGNAATVEALIAKLLKEEMIDLEDLYADEEIAPLLQGRAFAAVRAKYPPPATQPTTTPSTQPATR